MIDHVITDPALIERLFCCDDEARCAAPSGDPAQDPAIGMITITCGGEPFEATHVAGHCERDRFEAWYARTEGLFRKHEPLWGRRRDACWLAWQAAVGAAR